MKLDFRNRSVLCAIQKVTGTRSRIQIQKHLERKLLVPSDSHRTGPHSLLRNLLVASWKQETACNEKEQSDIHQLNNSWMFPAAGYGETENDDKKQELYKIKSCHTFT